MKNKKRIIIISLIIIFFLILTTIITMSFLKDENKLTVAEKQWINDNISNVQNVNIINNVDIAGKSGSGIFYDFIKEIKNEYNITVNPITYNKGEEVGARSFKIVTELNDKELVFKEEHFVLVGNNNKVYNLEEEINVGILNTDENLIKNYIKESNINFINYDTFEDLLNDLKSEEKITFILVPLDENMSTILSKDYKIYKHYSDIKKYFVYEIADNDPFSSILKKYFSIYKSEKLEESTNNNILNALTTALNINEKELTNIQAKEYNYGFVNNMPYEVITSGNYGGIMSLYLQKFSSVTNTDFKFTKYKNYNDFIEAIKNEKVDIYFNYYDLDTKFKTVDNGLSITYAILAKKSDNIVINSIESLRDKEVYVSDNSFLSKYLKEQGFIKVNTYKNEKELKRLIKKDVIIVIDHEIYNYYVNTLFNDYNSKYVKTIKSTYNFKVKEDNSFYQLFTKYISTLDNKEIVNAGLFNHLINSKKGKTLGRIAKYILIGLGIIILLLITYYRSSKKVKITSKIKKEDKIKYIDQLTSLKNRNYLNENIDSWNKNTIYPQAMIVLDLDNLQTINDTLGYEAGDEQIKAAANILIKTQIDNSDIIRTDGNEFLIYLVGYEEKQVVSYIRKLYKEFKTMPHEYGATIGFSMIVDDIKTIEDAVNEAVDDMKKKKEEQE